MAEQLLELWLHHLKPAVSAVWGSATFWRFCTLLLLTLLFVAYLLRSRIRNLLLAPARRRHDVEVFRAGDVVLPEETFDDCLNCLGGQYMYQMRHIKALWAYLTFRGRAANKYLDQRIARDAAAFEAALDQLDVFTAAHFFPDPKGGPADDDARYYLYPEFRWQPKNEEERETFQQRSQELVALVESAESAFRRYRATIKRVLLV
jgi:hypothetical protein